MRYFTKIFPVWLALAFTIVTLVLVGMGEARRNYFAFRLDTASLQSEAFLHIIHQDLENGTPIQSISGLSLLLSNLASSDETICGAGIIADEIPVVSVGEEVGVQAGGGADYSLSKVQCKNTTYRVYESKDFLRIEKTIATRFGEAGRIILKINLEVLTRSLDRSFTRIIAVASVVICLLYGMIVFAAYRFSEKPFLLKRIVQVSYFVVFFGISGVILYETLSIYNEAVTNKSKALGSFLAKRLSSVSAAKISFDDISGVDELLADFRAEHAEISMVELVVGSGKRYQASASSALTAPQADSDLIIQSIPLDIGGAITEPSNLLLSVKVPRSVVRDTAFNSCINLLVLLFGCTLVANMILETGVIQLSTSFGSGGKEGMVTTEQALGSMQTAYLIMGLINALTLPFLASMIKELAGGVSSLPFTAFFLCFAVFMIPAGKLAERGYTKHLLFFGILMEIVGCILVAVAPSLLILTIGRSFSGLGQGVFLIGFQSFIVSVTSKTERTQGQSLKVIIRYAVLVAGSAIGALMYVYFSPAIVFGISAMLGILSFFYVLFVVPSVNQVVIPPSDTMILRKKSGKPPAKFEFKAFLRIFIDGEFMKALLLSGIPSKIAVAGVVMFSIPLLLTESGVPSESIGRYLMLYYIASMVASHWSAKYADRKGHTKGLIVAASLLGGAGFMMLGGVTGGIIAVPSLVPWTVVLLAVSVALGGISNGFTAAPLLTHVGKTPSAMVHGTKTMIATYGFLERFGHISGSALIAFMAMQLGGMGSAIFYFGLALLVLGLVFQVTSRIR